VRVRPLVSPFFRILASFSVTCPRVCFAVSFEGHGVSYLVAFVFYIFCFLFDDPLGLYNSFAPVYYAFCYERKLWRFTLF
jgi:hypothetical protein